MTATSPKEAAATPAPATRPARVPRRAPTDLPFTFADRELAARLASERGEPTWLRDLRLELAAAFEAQPIEPNTLYTPYIDLRTAELFEARPWITTEAATSRDGDRGGLPDGVDGIIELRDDRVPVLALSTAAREAGVVVETFGAALARDEVAFRSRLAAFAADLPVDDKLARLAEGFWSQGVVVDVPNGVRLEHPILIRWALGEPGRVLLSRTLVSLGEAAHAALVEELVPAVAAAGTTVQSLFHGTTEVSLSSEARLEVASIQDLAPSQVCFQHRTARIGEGAQLHWALAQLGSRLTRSRIDNRLEGDRSDVEQVEIVFGSDDQLFDLTSYTVHIGRDTTGNLLAKGALLDRARSYMKGLSTIEKSAVGTDSFLGEFGMNLSRSARAVAIPSLEIDQPDCRRAAHSSSVGPIDPAQLFYLETRGIPPDEARKFVVLGFLEPVVARVPHEATQERLRALLDAKWDAGLQAADAAGAAA